MRPGHSRRPRIRRARHTYYRPRTTTQKRRPVHYPGDFLDKSTIRLKKRIGRRLGKMSEFLLLAMLTAFLVLFFTRQSMFLLFAAIAGYVKYVQTKCGSPIDVSPLFFFTAMIAAYSGVLTAFLFVIVADLIPCLLAGGIFEFVGFSTYALYLILAGVGSISPETIASTGVVLSVLNTMGCMTLNRVFGSLHSYSFVNILLHMLLNIFYFVKVAPYLIRILA